MPKFTIKVVYELAKLLQSFIIIFAFSNLLSAQTAPDLENGFKHYGSYDSSHLDTVNLQNGNLMLHAPLLPNYPQRGKLRFANVWPSTPRPGRYLAVQMAAAVTAAGSMGGQGVTLSAHWTWVFSGPSTDLLSAGPSAFHRA